MVRKMFCDKCKKEIEYQLVSKNSYFDSDGHMLDYCEPCSLSAMKIYNKYNKMVKKIGKERDKELSNIKPKSWWKL